MTDAREWTGPVGDVWAAEWQRTDRSFADLAVHLDAAIRDRMQGRAIAVADVGCGAGATSIAAATADSAARITGIDLSAGLIGIARDRAGNLPNASFVVGPVEASIAAAGPFDLIVSRHGVMFFDDPVAGLSAIRKGAKPGAELLFSCFRPAGFNPWASEIAAAIHGTPPAPPTGYAPGPFAFADEAFVRATLAAAGWSEASARAVDFHYCAGAGDDPVADAVDFFTHIGPAAPALRAADPGGRAVMLERIAAVCARYRTGDVVDFPAAAWLWSANNQK